MIRATADTYPISIFLAGNIKQAKRSCRELCDELGFCVTVTPTTYVYTGGEEPGFIIGIINYPRFPADRETLLDRAIVFAEKVRVDCGQDSYTIQAPGEKGTLWISHRQDSLAAEQNPSSEGEA